MSSRRHEYVRAVRDAHARSRPRRRFRAVALLLGTTALSVSLISFWPAADAATDGNYLDWFSTVSYTNSDGTLSWSGSPWQEIGEADGPSVGFVAYETIRCSAGSCLWFDDDLPGTPIGARRTANLSGSASATLTFDYQFEQDIASTATEFYLDVSTTSSGPWTRLATYVINTIDTAPRFASFDISAFISATTTVRILSNGADTDNEIYVDNFQIDAVPDMDPVFDQDITDRSDAEATVISFSATATDPFGDVLTYTATGLPAGITYGSSSGLVSGTISHSASNGSPYSVILSATDPGGNQVTDTFTWTVTNVNRTPNMNNLGDRSDAEGDVVSIALVGSDPDGDPVVWTATGLPSGLSIHPTTGVISGTISYDASPGSPFAVTVRLTDNGSPPLWVEETFTWTVTNTNRAPTIANPGAQTGAEGDVVTLAVSGSDPDGNTVTWSATNLPSGLSIAPGTGVISGTVSFGASVDSPYAVVIQATDNGVPVAQGTAAFSWTVTDTNRAPQVTNPGDRASNEGDPVTFAMSGSDPDDDQLTWTAAGLPPGLSIGSGTGVIAGTVSFDAAGTHAVTIRATDDGSPTLFAEVGFAWVVADVNRAPVVVDPSSQSTAEGDSVSLTINGIDPDLDSLTWTAAGLPPGLAIAPSTGEISGSPTFDAFDGSPYSVTVRATDDGTPALFDETTFVWAIADINRPPQVIGPGDRSNAEGDPVTFAIVGSDPDDDGLVWSATGLPAGLTIGSASGVINGTITYSSSGGSPYTVTVRATDDGTPSLYHEVTFSWAVAETNRSPVVTNPGSQNDAEGDPVSLAISGFDPDSGDTLAWTATGLPPGVTISSTTGQLTGTLGFSASGVRTVTVRATDNGNPSSFGEVVFTWTVSNTNRAPTVFNPGDQMDAEGTTISLDVEAADPDGNGIAFAGEGLPPGVTIDSSTGLISGTLQYNLVDSYAVVITVTDDGSPMLLSQVGFNWVIAEVNRPPVIGPIADRTTEEGVAVTISPTVTEPDGDTITWAATGLPIGVSMNPNTGLVSGSPATPGSYGVVFTATDSGEPAATDDETFTWTVMSPPGFPVIEPIAARHDLVDDSVAFTATAVHPDGLDITWAALALPPGMTLDPATGHISGVPTTPGTWFTRITVTDERSQDVTASFVWVVESGEDLPPVPGDDTVTVGIDEITSGGIALDAAGNDSDPEGLGVRVVSVSQPQVGEAELVDGIVVFRPPSGWLGTVIIRYVVADPAGNEAEGTITVTVLDSLDNRLVTGALTGGPTPGVVDLGALGALTPAAGTEMLLGSVFQSLYVLRVPLALLGGAVFWSLILGGILNLGFVLRGGVPRLVRRTSRNVAVVLVPHGGRVDVLAEPGRGELLTRLTATERGIEATGRRIVAPDGEEWAEIRTEEGVGWAPSFNLTEEVDRSGFASDPEAVDLVKGFVDRLRARREFSDLVSQHGLFVAHHAPLVYFAPGRLSGVMDDPTRLVWKGRNPAYPDFSGSFDLAVATGVLDAFDHPMRELLHDRPAAPSTVIPVEFTNLHFVSIGADVHGPERLEQSAWLVMISYEAAHPRILGLVREG